MDLNSLEGPSPYSGNILPEKVISEEKAENETLSLLKHLPFAEGTYSTPEKNFHTKKVPVEDTLLQELHQILQLQASQIEKALQTLENSKKGQKLVNALLEVESWGSWGYGSMDTSRANIQQGIEFLEHLFPHHLLVELAHHYKFEQLGNLTTLGTTFLYALDSGAQSLALILKLKILYQSAELLKQLKTVYAIKTEQQTLSPEELKKVHQTLREWEANIQLEEKDVKEEILQFKLNTTSTLLYILSLSLTYIPHEALLKSLQPFVSGLSWTMSGLEMLTSGLELAQTRKNTKTFHTWTQAYKKWQEEHQPRFQITEKGAQRKDFSPKTVPRALTVEEHEKTLFKFIETTQDFTQIRLQLKDLAIDLDSSLTSKEELLLRLETDPTYRHQLVTAYVQFQRNLEALNLVIQTSENLLAKRQAIIKKKIMLLKPHFHTVESKIQELKKAAFVRDMQQLLWQQMQDPHCSPQEIKQHLQKWGFYDSSPSEKNQKFLQTFEQFEKTKQEGTETSSWLAQQSLKNEFSQWMDDSTAMDGQFQAWYQAQSQENLMTFYVDHQETLEQTTKNSLKQMVQQKHEIEDRFIHFKLTQSYIHFSVAAIALTVSVTLAILGLLSLPFGGVGLLLLTISLGSTAVSLGLLGASYYHAYHNRPHATQTFSLSYQAKMMWSRLRASIQDYSHQAKEKKLLEVSKILHKLHSSSSADKQSVDYQKALADFKKAKLEFDESEKKVQEWTQHLKRLETHLTEKSWQDFAQHASLQIGNDSTAFDTLRSFQEALQACDLRLLSEETKTLLTLQLGINLEALQVQMQKDPDAIKNTLQEFFILDDANLVSFIKGQKMRMKKKLIQL